MLAEDVIVYDLPVLEKDNTCGEAEIWMDEFKVSHLPVLDLNEYVGLVSENEILECSPETKISSLIGHLEKPSAKKNMHLYEVVKFISEFNLSVIPILDMNEKYLGSTSAQQLMGIIAAMPVIENPGGIIVLELNKNDYSLTQVANIVESNDAKILGTFITSHSDTMKIRLTVKTNKEDLSGILQSFDRYQYKVEAYYDPGNKADDLQDRYDNLMRYLNI